MTEGMRRIGIPRALLYHKRAALWGAFFSTLGVEMVVSPPTNRAIIESGCSVSVDETCLSIKVALGHVAWLADRSETVLCPRYVSMKRGELECSKLWGIYDVARNSVPGVDIVGYSVDGSKETHRRTREPGELYRLARRLGAPPSRAALATARAISAHRQAASERVRAQEALRDRPSDRPRVLVAGHAYNLYDESIGLPIITELKTLGCEVVDSEGVDHALAARLAKRLSPQLYWTNSRQLLGAVEHWREHVDGIIFLVTFPCGPDSLVTELATRRIKGVPMVTLIIDEHSGETGLRTRLESFVDILHMRRGDSVAGGNPGAVA
ncbi:MAG TPA: acyl-CoA dehydratase activase-related protein [Coriobacteriia bacterium]